MIKDIKDECGYTFKDAFVGIIMCVDNAKTLRETNGTDLAEEQSRFTGLDSISYKVSYYYSNLHYSEGYPARRLLIKSDTSQTGYTDEISVDMTNPDVVSIINQGLEHDKMIDACIGADLDYRFKV